MQILEDLFLLSYMQKARRDEDNLRLIAGKLL